MEKKLKTLFKQEKLCIFTNKRRKTRKPIILFTTGLFLVLAIGASSLVSATWVAAYRWTVIKGSYISGGSSELLNSDNQYLVAQESIWLDIQFDIRKYGSYTSVTINFEVENHRPQPYWSIEVWVWTKSQTWEKRWFSYYSTSGTLAGGFSTSEIFYSMGYSSVKIAIICDEYHTYWNNFYFDRVRGDF